MRQLKRVTDGLLFISAASMLLCGLTGCGTSSSTTPAAISGNSTTTQTQPASLSSAMTALQKNMAAEAPHVVNASVVTAYDWRSWRPFHWSDLHFIPAAFADDIGLSTIWDPQNGSPPSAGNFATTNLYNGGGFTCTETTNTCTNGTLTIAGLESLKDYMGQALDPNFVNSNGASVTLFGRLGLAVQITCALGQLVPAASIDTDGLPVVGTLTLNLPADTTNIVYQPRSAGGCGLDTASAGMSPVATITAVTSTDYTKEMVMQMGGQMIVTYLKLDTTAGDLNIMSLDDERSSGRYAVSRTIAHITGTNAPGTGTVLFEYISIGSATSNPSVTCYAGGRWSCSYEFHRVYINEATDVAYLVSNIGSPGDNAGGTGAPTYYVQYTVAAKPSAMKACTAGSTCNSTLALSVTADGQTETNSTVYPSAGISYDGCVNISDRSIGTDGVLTCDVTGSSILATGGASAMIEQTRQVYVADVVATLLTNTTAATTLAFTGATNIYTAPNTH